eukprot:1155364-Pleurochrysis_carterae.AAC.2
MISRGHVPCAWLKLGRWLSEPGEWARPDGAGVRAQGGGAGEVALELATVGSGKAVLHQKRGKCKGGAPREQGEGEKTRLGANCKTR